jgi:protein TonB
MSAAEPIQPDAGTVIFRIPEAAGPVRGPDQVHPLRRAFRALATLALGAATTLGLFLLLPLLETITEAPEADLLLRRAETTSLPPPPPPSEPEREEDPPPEPQPPELAETQTPLELSQLELVLGAGAGGGFGTLDVGAMTALRAETAPDATALFALSDLDQKPRVVYQPSPSVPASAKKRLPGTVAIVFIVDEEGRVTNPTVQKSSDPVFEGPALAAVKQWRFEPGRRSGKPVRFKMRVPITFPEG